MRASRYHWREGRRRGYPACCVAHFCWDALMGWPASVTRWRETGRVPADDGGPVECGVLHAGSSQYVLSIRVVRIVRHQIEHLPLTAKARERRATALHGSRAWHEAAPAEKSRASAERRLAQLYWSL